ncbi:GDSL/SGNH-like acyl-esterase family protein [Nitzschia inconspicua]|uniref:GDSL/SGNH-like acyl-esterase family protein n=1 Tax=Nitzschia inconspicua TaxID=303405 RepID=A0A9K3M1L2_9STRA|nr:GDSL/SGNH-like acyl-esterase family protein [Nitzschia inconspicua]KAG7372424.1 GDSL/SGNH-like acyl-esterase family protein [Nitzschia inconspicua]
MLTAAAKKNTVHRRMLFLLLAFLIVSAVGSWRNSERVSLWFRPKHVEEESKNRNIVSGTGNPGRKNDHRRINQTNHHREQEPSASDLIDNYDYDYCIKHRGTRGRWYINETMGKETFYALGPRSSKWNRVNKNNLSAVYSDNKYAWHDETVDSRGCRPIEPVNKERFCSVIQQLEIQRLFFVGDSLMHLQCNSLLSLLGYQVTDFFSLTKQKVNVTRTTIDCPDYPPIDFRFRRQNLGPNLRLTELSGRDDATRNHRQQFGPEIPFCTDGRGLNASDDGAMGHCPWMEDYVRSSKKTLLVLNQGAHFHSIETFQKSFDLFVQQFNAVAHYDDIVVFRNTAPGHKDCFSVQNKTVFFPNEMTHDIFLDRFATSLYDWNIFDDYNQLARKSLSSMQKSQSMYLNIYNMTILRPDGHSSENDCLHYMLPGPVDFWNHLLFTNLADLATAATAKAS